LLLHIKKINNMGEITKNSSFGKSIIDVVKKEKLRRVLEIGSWDGTGSTQCLIEGMSTLDDPKLYCLEVKTDRYNQLLNNTSNYDWVICKNISSISKKTLLVYSFEEIWQSEYNKITNTKDIVKRWFESGMAELLKCKEGYLDNDTNFYDAVLIDGGEFFGYSEYVLLKNRTNFFFLDDCHTAYKTRQVFVELMEDDEWEIVFNSSERNGYAAFKRKVPLIS